MVMSEERLGAYLKRLREVAGYESADQVERWSKQRVRAHTIRAIERGGVERPLLETLQVLAEAYRVNVSDLMQRAGYPVPATAVEHEPLDPDTRAIVEVYRTLDAVGRRRIATIIREAVELYHAGKGSEAS